MEIEDEPIKPIQPNMLLVGDIEANQVLELQNNEANDKLSALVLTMPMPESPIKHNSDHK